VSFIINVKALPEVLLRMIESVLRMCEIYKKHKKMPKIQMRMIGSVLRMT
jgi:hypothetical protein